MKTASEQTLFFSGRLETQRGRAQTIFVVLVAFVSGIAIGGFAVYRVTSHSAAGSSENTTESQSVTAANAPTVVSPPASSGSRGTSVVVWQPKSDAAAIEEVKRSMPDIASVSIEEGTRILREAAFKEFATRAQELRAQLNEAEQRLANAQLGASETERQAAMKHLQDVQQKQTEELKKLAERSQARIAAFQQLKSGKP